LRVAKTGLYLTRQKPRGQQHNADAIFVEFETECNTSRKTWTYLPSRYKGRRKVTAPVAMNLRKIVILLGFARYSCIASSILNTETIYIAGR